MGFSEELAAPINELAIKFGLFIFISYIILSIVFWILRLLRIPKILHNFILTISYILILYKIGIELFV